jgi:hypothetical protein
MPPARTRLVNIPPEERGKREPVFYTGGLLAVILAAGAGTRLRPLTDATPKCLLDINGRPLLDRLLEGLAAAGLERAVIVTGHLSERVEAHLADMPPPLDVMVVTNPVYRTTNNGIIRISQTKICWVKPGTLVFNFLQISFILMLVCAADIIHCVLGSWPCLIVITGHKMILRRIRANSTKSSSPVWGVFVTQK